MANLFELNSQENEKILNSVSNIGSYSEEIKQAALNVLNNSDFYTEGLYKLLLDSIKQGGQIGNISTDIVNSLGYDEQIKILEKSIKEYQVEMSATTSSIYQSVKSIEISGKLSSGLRSILLQIESVTQSAIEDIAAIDLMIADSKLDTNELTVLRTIWNRLKLEYPTYIRNAQLNDVDTTAFTQTYNDMNDFIEPIFSQKAPVSIDGNLLKSKIEFFFEDRLDLLNGIYTSLKAVTDALVEEVTVNAGTIGSVTSLAVNTQLNYQKLKDTIRNICSNGILTPAEKNMLKGLIDYLLEEEYPEVLDLATSHSLPTTNYTESKVAIESFLTVKELFTFMTEQAELTEAEINPLVDSFYSNQILILNEIIANAKEALNNTGVDVEENSTKIIQTDKELSFTAETIQAVGKQVEVTKAETTVQSDRIVSIVSGTTIYRDMDKSFYSMNGINENLYSMIDSTPNVLDPITGLLLPPSNDSLTSTFMITSPSMKYIVTVFNNLYENEIIISWYDTNMNFIRSDSIISSEPRFDLSVESPNNASFARISTYNTDDCELQFELGDVASGYKPAINDIINNIYIAKSYYNGLKEDQTELSNYISSLNESKVSDLAIYINIVSDGNLSPTEKTSLLTIWNRIKDEFVLVSNYASDYQVDSSTYTGFYNNLSSYITNLLSSLENSSTVSSIIAENNLNRYYNARDNLLLIITSQLRDILAEADKGLLSATATSAEAEFLKNDISIKLAELDTVISRYKEFTFVESDYSNLALDDITAFTLDGILTPVEKVTVKDMLYRISVEDDWYIKWSNFYGLGHGQYDYDKELLLEKYSPMLNINSSQIDSTLGDDPNLFVIYFENYYSSKQALLGDIISAAEAHYAVLTFQLNEAQIQSSLKNEEYLRYLDTIDDVQDSINIITDDNRLNFQDRIALANSLSQVIGTMPSTSTSILYEMNLPNEEDLTIGSYTTIRKSAVELGISTIDSIYIGLEIAYNSLKDYLDGIVSDVKVWDIREINRGTIVNVDGDTFRSKWLDYYNAENELQKAILSIPGPDGKSSYLHVKYSNDEGLTFTANNGEDVGSYIGTYNDFLEEDSMDLNAYKWVKMSGDPAVIIRLNASPQYFTFDGENNPVPEVQTVTLTARILNSSGTAIFTATPYDRDGNSYDNLVLSPTLNENEVTLTVDQFANYDQVRVVVSAMGVEDTDIVTVHRLRDGASGKASINIMLSNDQQNIPTYEDGTGGDFTNVYSDITVLSGDSDVTADWVINADTPVGVTGQLVGNRYTVTDMSIDSANIEFSATNGGLTVTKVFTVTKLRQGVTGTPTINATLSNELFVIPTLEDGTGGDYEDLFVSMTIMKGDTNDTANWTITTLASSGVVGTFSGNTYDVNDLTTDSGTVSFTAVQGDLTVEKVLSISKTKQGSSALSIDLTNEYHGVPTDENGNYGIYTDAISEVHVFKGTVDVTDEFTITTNASPGITGTLTLNSYHVTNMSYDTGIVEFVATKGTTVLRKTFSLIKNRQGITGKASVSLDLTNDIGIIPTLEDGTDGDYAGITTSVRVLRGTEDDSSNWTITATPGYGITGTFVNNVYTVTDMDTARGEVLFRATNGSLIITKTYVLSKSMQGVSSIVLSLTNEFINIATDEDGDNGNYIGLSVTASVVKGINDDTDNWSFITSASSGVVGSLVGKTYTLTNLTVDQGTVEFIGKKGTQTVRKTVTFNKIKQAISTYNGFLTNETFIIPTLEDGNGGDFDEIFASMVIHKGDLDDTANWVITTSESSGVSGLLTGNMYDVSGMTADTGKVTFTATKGFRVITKVLTLTKQRQAAATYNLSLSNDSVSVFTLEDGTDGDYSNVFTELTIYRGGEVNTDSWTVTTDPSSGVSGYLSSDLYFVTELSEYLPRYVYYVTNMTVDNGSVEFIASNSNTTIKKVFSISKIKQGKSPYIISLSSDNHSIITEEDGTGGDFTNVYTDVIIMKDDLDVTDAWTINIEAPVGVTGSLIDNRYRISALADDNNEIRFVCTNAGRTLLKSYIINKLRKSPIPNVGYLTNDMDSVATLSDGTGGDFTDVATALIIKKGDVDVSSSWTISAVPSAGISGRLTNNVYQVLDMTTDSGKVILIAFNGSETITKEFVITKVRQGFSNIVYSIGKSHSIIIKDQDNVFHPTSVTFSGTMVNGNDEPINYAGFFRIYEQNGVSMTIDEYGNLMTAGAILPEKEYIISDIAHPYVLRYESALPEVLVDYIPFSTDALSIHVEFYDDHLHTRLLDSEAVMVSAGGKDSYDLRIMSTQGGMFKNGVINTVLSAHLFRGDTEITSHAIADRFIWTRTSSDPAADIIWNANNGNGVKSIEIDGDDVHIKATFNCVVVNL